MFRVSLWSGEKMDPVMCFRTAQEEAGAVRFRFADLMEKAGRGPEHVSVEIWCGRHGWTDTKNGDCPKCYGEELSAFFVKIQEELDADGPMLNDRDPRFFTSIADLDTGAITGRVGMTSFGWAKLYADDMNALAGSNMFRVEFLCGWHGFQVTDFTGCPVCRAENG